MYNTTTTIIGVQHEGYTNGAVLFKQVYKDVPTAVRGDLWVARQGQVHYQDVLQ